MLSVSRHDHLFFPYLIFLHLHQIIWPVVSCRSKVEVHVFDLSVMQTLCEVLYSISSTEKGTGCDGWSRWRWRRNRWVTGTRYRAQQVILHTKYMNSNRCTKGAVKFSTEGSHTSSIYNNPDKAKQLSQWAR